MRSTAHDLTGLIMALEAGFDAERARLAAQGRRIAQLREHFQALDLRSGGNDREAFDPAERAGADLAWHGWVEGRRRQINAELLRLREQQEAQRARVADAFGKLTAARTLHARLRLEERRRQRRGG